MHLIPISAAGRLLVQIVSSSAVRIALGATLTTPQPIAAFQGVASTAVVRSVPTVTAANPVDGSTPAADARQLPVSDFVGVEPGPGLG